MSFLSGLYKGKCIDGQSPGGSDQWIAYREKFLKLASQTVQLCFATCSSQTNKNQNTALFLHLLTCHHCLLCPPETAEATNSLFFFPRPHQWSELHVEVIIKNQLYILYIIILNNSITEPNRTASPTLHRN